MVRTHDYVAFFQSGIFRARVRSPATYGMKVGIRKTRALAIRE